MGGWGRGWGNEKGIPTPGADVPIGPFLSWMLEQKKDILDRGIMGFFTAKSAERTGKSYPLAIRIVGSYRRMHRVGKWESYSPEVGFISPGFTSPPFEEEQTEGSNLEIDRKLLHLTTRRLVNL